MTEIHLPNNWGPRDYQKPLWNHLQDGGKRAIAVWHRRAGKDDVCLHWTACAAMQAVGNYWHMLPEATQARKAIWKAVNPHSGVRRIDEAFPKEIRKSTNDTEMFIEFVNGSTWQVLGSDNYDSYVGSAPIGIVFSEWALADPAAWAYVRPILRENSGWALFISTPRGRNHLATFYHGAEDDPDWFVERLPATKTSVFTPEALEQERKELIREYDREAGQNLFEQEYLCSFDAAVLGSYYGWLLKQAGDEGRITRVPYDASKPVYTAWDLGYDDDTAIWFAQIVGRAVHVIDFYASRKQDLAHYAGVLKEKRYTYATCFLPHDGGHGSRQTAKTDMDILYEFGFDCSVGRPASKNCQQEIQAVRAFIPKCYFDATKCRAGLDALMNYQSEYDDKLKKFKSAPLHDWSSHAADAFRELAVQLMPDPGPEDYYDDPMATYGQDEVTGY